MRTKLDGSYYIPLEALTGDDAWVIALSAGGGYLAQLGREEKIIDRFFLGYLASFPDAVLTVESATANHDAGQAPRVALRWSLRGTHAGFGRFGEPTGAPVYVMGLSHAEIVGGCIRREWLLTDEVVIWKQIEAHLEGRAGAG